MSTGGVGAVTCPPRCHQSLCWRAEPRRTLAPVKPRRWQGSGAAADPFSIQQAALLPPPMAVWRVGCRRPVMLTFDQPIGLLLPRRRLVACLLCCPPPPQQQLLLLAASQPLGLLPLSVTGPGGGPLELSHRLPSLLLLSQQTGRVRTHAGPAALLAIDQGLCQQQWRLPFEHPLLRLPLPLLRGGWQPPSPLSLVPLLRHGLPPWLLLPKGGQHPALPSAPRPHAAAVAVAQWWLQLMMGCRPHGAPPGLRPPAHRLGPPPVAPDPTADAAPLATHPPARPPLQTTTQTQGRAVAAAPG